MKADFIMKAKKGKLGYDACTTSISLVVTLGTSVVLPILSYLKHSECDDKIVIWSIYIALALCIISALGSVIIQSRLWLAAIMLCLLELVAITWCNENRVTCITTDWPSETPLNEAAVGGRLRGINSADDSIFVYVCTAQTEDGPLCFFQENNQGPTIESDIWRSFARFGNETSEVNAVRGKITFHVVAAAGRQGIEPELPKTCKGTASDITERLRNFDRISVISRPHKIERLIPPAPKIVFTTLKDKAASIDLKRRLPIYFVTPPVVLEWEETAFVQESHDGAPVNSISPADAYRLMAWPPGVHRIEIKVSESESQGPYDSIYLHFRGPVSPTDRFEPCISREKTK